MSSDWSCLPSENLQQIFENCNPREVKHLALVCKNWCYEAHFHLRDKVGLCIDRVQDEKLLGSRRFEKIIIPRLCGIYLEDCLSIIKSLRDRKNKIKQAEIAYEDYPDMIEVLSHLGTDLHSLNLKALDGNWIYDQGFSDFSLDNLSSVQNLTIEGIAKHFDKLGGCFGNLKTLNVIGNSSDRNILETVKVFVKNNPLLEDLFFKNLNSEENAEADFIHSLSHLKNLRMNDSGMTKNLLKKNMDLEELDILENNLTNDDLFRIRRNFPKMKDLSITTIEMFHTPQRFTKEGLKMIWEMESLRKLSLDTFNFKNKVWEECCFKSINENLTSLCLSNIMINDEFMIKATEVTPNIEYFEANILNYEISFRFIQEMATNWVKLKELNIFISHKIEFKKNLLKYDPSKTPAFEKLETFILHSDLVDLSLEFFKYFRMPNMKNLAVDLQFYMHAERNGTKEKSNKIIPLIVKNSPLIEKLSIMYGIHVTPKTISIICQNLKNLKEITLEKCANLPLLTVQNILKYSKSIQLVNMFYFKDIRLLRDCGRIQNFIRKFCESLTPPLRPVTDQFKIVNKLQRDGVDVVLDTEYFDQSIYYTNSGSDEDSEDDSTDEEEDNDEDDEEYSVYSDSDDEESYPVVLAPPKEDEQNIKVIMNEDVMGSDDDDTDYSEGMESFDEGLSEEETDESLAVNNSKDKEDDDNIELPAKRSRKE